MNTLADFIAPGDTLPAEIHNMFISNVPAWKVERKSPFTFSCKDAGRIVVPTLVLRGIEAPEVFAVPRTRWPTAWRGESW